VHNAASTLTNDTTDLAGAETVPEAVSESAVAVRSDRGLISRLGRWASAATAGLQDCVPF